VENKPIRICVGRRQMPACDQHGQDDGRRPGGVSLLNWACPSPRHPTSSNPPPLRKMTTNMTIRPGQSASCSAVDSPGGKEIPSSI
jgi:hypothetical protein